MKEKLKVLKLLVFCTLFSLGTSLVSCGDDDGPEIVDGVRVNKGRKLKELAFADPKYKESSKYHK